MRVVSVGQVLSPSKDKYGSAVSDIDGDGVATREDCGDSSFARYDLESRIVTCGVFDGVGSCNNDVLSSQTVCGSVSGYLKRPLSPESIVSDLYNASFSAFQALRNYPLEDKANGLSSTATYVVVLPGGEAFIVNCGDSRCYRFRDGELQMLTIDDRSFHSISDLEEPYKSLYEKLSVNDGIEGIKAMQGLKTADEALEFYSKRVILREESELRLLLAFQEYFSNIQFKDIDDATSTEKTFGVIPAGIVNRGNIIVRSIDSASVPYLSITKTHLEEGDILFLCTDGLSDVLPTDDIKKQIDLWKTAKPHVIARMLIDYTRELVRENRCFYTRNKEDDIGVAVVKWGEKK